MSDLNALSLTQLATVFSNAVDDYTLLGVRKVSKFKDKATGITRVQHLISTYDLELIGEGETVKLVKADPEGKEDRQAERLKEQTMTEKTDTAAEKEPKAPKEPTERKQRVASVSRDPRPAKEIHACRAGSNQALLVDALHSGTSIEAATRNINTTLGKSLSSSVIYSTILYDVCTVKGYGVRVEPMNGEQLAAHGLAIDAEEFGWDTNKNEAREGYDPAKVRAVYFLRLAEGMDGPVPHTERKPKPEPKAKKADKAAPENKDAGAAPEAKDEEPAAEAAEDAASDSSDEGEAKTEE